MWIYRLLIGLAAPLLWAHRIWRAGGAREAIFPSHPLASANRTLWIHAASNGEITSAIPLLIALLERDPALHLAITVNTPSAVEAVRGWDLPRSHVSYAPLDLRWRIEGFLKVVKPAAILIIENEFWPNKILTAHARGVPVLVAGARLSKTSARRWRYLPKLAQRMTQGITALSPQDPASSQRFLDLGLPEAKMLSELNLKLFYTPPKVTPPKTDRAQTILAASTHDGEDVQVIAAFAAAHRLNPKLRLIIAPRHPRRASAVIEAAAQHGLAIAQRSAGAAFDETTPIWLADTMGEMAHWYDASGLCFIGGSLVEKGGHTPFEPAAHGMALLTGPHIENFEPHFEALQNAGAAQILPNAEALKDAFIALPKTSKLRDMGQAAQAYHAQKGSLDPLIDAIRKTL
ncbi:3-deoxy-D-manno-octulosonic acid transferase [Cognatishimia sp. MH4019]|uniref:3-deoxy-D-manno-octulosonic acid transferase n=1 Tax=Cognatishimia sp. MH4019 TaxID=2854030 RepID=UPI001CD3C1AD|nr:glycosyltransferase N-terminal domain-containing protein [Cognatishimia sp. MH4019]